MSTAYQRKNERSQTGKREPLEGEIIEGEVLVQSNFAESQSRGEVDMQISTAKRYPRSLAKCRERAISYATIDLETAESCIYKLPGRKKPDGTIGDPIEGPSVRLAEIVAGTWSNLRVSASIVDDDGEFLTAQGRAWDLETNVAISMEVRQRVLTKGGQRYGADMLKTTSNAICSIAFRNAVFKVVPVSVVRPVMLEARRVAIGDAATLKERREKAVQYFGSIGVSPERMCAALGRASVEDITVDDIGVLVGFRTAIKDGETTVDEAFPKLAPSKTNEATAATGAATPPAADATPPEKPDLLKSVRERILACDTEEAIAAISEQLSADPDLKPEQFDEINTICEGRIELLKRKKGR